MSLSQDGETIIRGDFGNCGVSERVVGAASNHLVLRKKTY